MGLSDIFLLLVVVALIFGGGLFILELADTGKGTSCENPYIRFAGDCCLDLDANRICDSVQLLKQGALLHQQVVMGGDSNKKDTNILERQNHIQEQDIRFLELQLSACNRDKRETRHHNNDFDLVVFVRDEKGDRLDDARVELENGDDEIEFTGNDGRAEFNNIEEDCYDITVSKRGYRTERIDACLDEDEDVLHIFLDES